MYFPILRGRQFELLALRECIDKKIFSDRIIPIIEPVKVSTTFIKTVESFIKDNRKLAIIRNPQVGSWDKELVKESNTSIGEKIEQLYKNSNVISSFYVTSDFENQISMVAKDSFDMSSLLILCLDPEMIDNYEKTISGKTPLISGNTFLYNIIPDKGEFRRRIRINRVMCEDHFQKQSRNVDYSNIETEFFSSDHLYYKDDGYIGYSDYSVVGEDYSETGFAPYAVAIHIVYFDEKKHLKIAHFVSDSNEDISDPARKFAEAVKKLVDWNKKMKLNTLGIHCFEEAYKNQTYPGLGVIKKYSIMHHLELIGNYLEEVE